MPLRDIIGQPGPVRLLARLVARRRLPHALLLDGLPGCGRRTLALALAGALLCEQPVEGDACGRCTACRLVAAGTHPDLAVLPHDSDAEDYSVDLVRDQAVRPAGESALYGRGRVFVLPGIERLQPAAANALLKVIEEPPAGVYFIMTTAQVAMVLPTIRSRAQVLRLLPLDAVALAGVLVRGGLDPAMAAARAAQGGGSHRGLWNDTSEPPLAELLALVRDGHDSRTIAEVVARLPQDEEEGGRTLPATQRLACRNWLNALCQQLRGDLAGDQPAAAVERIERVLVALKDLQRNLNPRLVLEALAIGTSRA